MTVSQPISLAPLHPKHSRRNNQHQKTNEKAVSVSDVAASYPHLGKQNCNAEDSSNLFGIVLQKSDFLSNLGSIWRQNLISYILRRYFLVVADFCMFEKNWQLELLSCKFSSPSDAVCFLKKLPYISTKYYCFLWKLYLCITFKSFGKKNQHPSAQQFWQLGAV